MIRKPDMKKLFRRDLLKSAAGAGFATLAAPMINRGRYRLFAASAKEYSARARVMPAVAFALILCGIWVSSYSEYVKAFVQDVELTSPRLSALKKEVEAGNRAVLESFWQDVTKQGAPLIEPFKGDDRHVLLTFLLARERGNQKRGRSRV